MPSERTHTVAVVCLLSIHVLVDLLIVMSIGRVENRTWVAVVAAVPIAQATLVALWASRSRAPSYVRFPLLAIALAWLWYVEMTALDMINGEPMSSAHAVALAVQAVVILTVLGVVRLADWIAWRRRTPDAPPPQYGIAALLLWTAAVALILGLSKTALAHCHWAWNDFTSPSSRIGVVVGAYNACAGLLVIAAVSGRRWRLPRAVVALAAVPLLAWWEVDGVRVLADYTGSIQVRECIALISAQAVYLLVTLLPLRLCSRHTPCAVRRVTSVAENDIPGEEGSPG
jgi:hypothetical protein